MIQIISSVYNFEYLDFVVDFQEKEEDGRTSEEDREDNPDGTSNGIDHLDDGTEHKLHSHQNIQVSVGILALFIQLATRLSPLTIRFH